MTRIERLQKTGFRRLGSPRKGFRYVTASGRPRHFETVEELVTSRGRPRASEKALRKLLRQRAA
jgi:hypothetical protein